MSRIAAAACIALGAAACGDTSGAPDAAPAAPDEGALTRAASLSAVCSGCHLSNREAGAIADLSDMAAAEIGASFRLYRDDPGATAMHRLARGYSDGDIDLIAEYLASDGGGG